MHNELYTTPDKDSSLNLFGRCFKMKNGTRHKLKLQPNGQQRGERSTDCKRMTRAPLVNKQQSRIEHIILHCPVAREVWWAILNWANIACRFQTGDTEILEAWKNMRNSLRKNWSRGPEAWTQPRWSAAAGFEFLDRTEWSGFQE